MKNIIYILSLFFVITISAQEQTNLIPQISVSGEGKIKVVPDMVEINVGFMNSGKDAKEVKKANDAVVDKVVKFLKKSGILATDYKTTQVSLYKSYDYQKKANNYQANQSLTLTLKDLSKYGAIMDGLNEAGVNSINGIEFKSSKMEELEREARKKAMLDAKQKAEDYASVLGQKSGKAINITDNSTPYNPQLIYRNKMMAMGASDSVAEKETLAIGEIEIKANVSVTFTLE